MPLTAHHRHYFTIEQRETLQHQLDRRAAELRAAIEIAALEREVRELRAVEAARNRLHEPDFGLCADCEAEIPYARLSANPTATRCVGCEAQHERGAATAPRL